MRVTVLLLVPLFSLVALWGFAVSLTFGSAVQKYTVATTYKYLGRPSSFVSTQLQAERALSVVALAGDQASRAALQAQRARTDAAIGTFRRMASSEKAREATDRDVEKRLEALNRSLTGLGSVRASVDAGAVGTLTVINSYGAHVDAATWLFNGLIVVNDLDIYREGTALVNVGRAVEYLLREDALITGAQLTGGRITTAERLAFTQWVATRRQSLEMGLSELTGGIGAPLRRFAESPSQLNLRAMEQSVVTSRSPRLPAELAGWVGVNRQIQTEVVQAVNQAGAGLAERAEPISDRIIARLVVAGGFGLLTVIVSIVLSIFFTQGLVRELRALRRAAVSLADERLPSVVDRLRRGDDVDVHAEAPPLAGGRTNEVAEVADAFTRVQRTAVEAAVGEAHLRRGISRVFLNIAWRSQSLLHRQLRMLDGMERRNTDPEVVADLFRLDHLTTRMRRHAEGLVILSGATPGRGWSRPVPIEDVLRAAASEVEDYTRVDAVTTSRSVLAGPVVADVVHLLAELIENATIFSPPRTRVMVRGEVVGNGFAIEVMDRGIGIDPRERAELNQRLARPPEFDLADTDRLGLFVVATLATRHGIRVALQESPYGGTLAVVLIPYDLVAEEGQLEAGRPEETGGTAGRPVDGTLDGTVDGVFERTLDGTFGETHDTGRWAEPRPAPAGPSRRPGGRATAIRAWFEPQEAAEPHAGGPAAGPETGRDAATFTTQAAAGSKPRLPRRERQANLAPQLRSDAGGAGTTAQAAAAADAPGTNGSRSNGSGAHTAAASAAEERSAEESRDLMSSLQAGWSRGRADDDEAESGLPGWSEWSDGGER